MAPIAKYLLTLALALTASALIIPNLPKDSHQLRDIAQKGLPISVHNPDSDDDTTDQDTPDSDGGDNGDLGYMNGVQYGQGMGYFTFSRTSGLTLCSRNLFQHWSWSMWSLQ